MINLVLLDTYQKIYIAAGTAAILLILFLLGLFIYKRVYKKRHYKEVTFLKLSHLAKANDYLLLNNFKLDFDDQHIANIDHILISKKYIFLITDFDLSGVISGELRDPLLRVANNYSEAVNVSNPLNYNINLVKRLHTAYRFDPSFLKGVVVINDDAVVNITNPSDQFFMVTRKDLPKLIRKFDREKIANLKEKDVLYFISKLDKDNKKKNEK